MTALQRNVSATGSASRPHDRAHFAGLDLLRFVAAMIVAMLHLAFWSWWPAGKGGTIQTAYGSLPTFPELQPIAWIGWVGVEIFFVISGFVIAYSAGRSPASDFAVGRFARLMPGVWLGMTIGALFLSLFGTMSWIAILTRWANSLVISPYPFWIDGVLWSLSVEMVFYGLVWTLLFLNAGRHIPNLMLAVGSISGLYSIAGLVGLFEEHNFILRLLLIEHGCYFSLGVLTYEIWVSGKRSKLWQFWLMTCFCLAALWWATEGKMTSFGITGGAMLPTVIWLSAIAWLLFSVSNPRWAEGSSPLVRQGLRRLGLMTFPLYLVHSLTGGAVLLLLGSLNRWAALVAALISSLAMSWLLAVHVEPILQSWCKRWLNRAVRDLALPRQNLVRCLKGLD